MQEVEFPEDELSEDESPGDESLEDELPEERLTRERSFEELSPGLVEGEALVRFVACDPAPGMADVVSDLRTESAVRFGTTPSGSLYAIGGCEIIRCETVNAAGGTVGSAWAWATSVGRDTEEKFSKLAADGVRSIAE